MNLKILSIVTASPGWVAEFSNSDGFESHAKVAVWAVVFDEDGYRITGFSESDSCGFLTPDDCDENFSGWKLKE